MEEQYNLSGLAAVMDNRFQINQALGAKYQEIRVLEPVITKDVLEVVEKLGNSLAGLKYATKTASSVDDKIVRAEKTHEAKSDKEQKEEFSPMAEMLSFKDMVRYTQICDHDKIVDTTKETIAALEKSGYTLSCVKNYFVNPYPETNYRGMHLNFITPYGQEIELQVHSQESFDVKQKGHKEYETARSVSTNELERAQALERVRKVHDEVSAPPRADEVQEYRMSDVAKAAIKQRGRNDTWVFVHADEDKHSKAYALKYSIMYKEREIASGFELKFTDGSAWVYRNDEELGTAEKFTVNKAGLAINRQEAVPHMQLSISQLKALAERQEEKYIEYITKVEERAAKATPVLQNRLENEKKDKSISTVKNEDVR